ncbi:hypothetical protein DAI22_01g187701 [Oryza sativa Japonica Group]|nr:hypothetical protein DAI22_01g187701 [Oryza sativa Japonica Group]
MYSATSSPAVSQLPIPLLPGLLASSFDELITCVIKMDCFISSSISVSVCITSSMGIYLHHHQSSSVSLATWRVEEASR